MSNNTLDRLAFSALSWLLAPLPPEEFLGSYWAKQSLLIERRQLDYYAELSNGHDVRQMVATAFSNHGAVQIISSEQKPEPCQSLTAYDEALKTNLSIRINHVQEHAKSIHEFCNKLTRELSIRPNVNAYITPKTGRAIAKHYDTHDVFVLQISGQKRWRLYDGTVRDPLEHLPQIRGESGKDLRRIRVPSLQSPPNQQELTDEFDLLQGDLLYVPRGVWHEAETLTEQTSCHLTLGITPWTYADLWSVAIGHAAEKLPLLRRGLPLGFSNDPAAQQEIAACLVDSAQEITSAIDSKAAVGVFAEMLHRTQLRSTPEATITKRKRSDPEIIANDEQLIRLTDSRAEIRAVGDRLLLENSTHTYTFHVKFEKALRAVLSAHSFTIESLPNDLSPAERMFLAHQVLNAGLFATRRSLGPDSLIPSQVAWLPRQLDLDGGFIQWVRIGDEQLDGPFLDDAIDRFVERSVNPAIEWRALQDFRFLLPTLKPSGFIFHISRCGSTVLSNALQTLKHTVVISEPHPINVIAEALLLDASQQKYTKAELEKMLLQLIRAYSQQRNAQGESVVFKFTSSNLLLLETFRRLWPEVPYVVVVRDPLEVCVSCIEQPTGWLRKQLQKPAISDSSQCADEVCTHFIAKLMDSALQRLDPCGVIVDYSDLNPTRVMQIAEFFSLRLTAENLPKIEQSFGLYSKDNRGAYEPDSEAKRRRASKHLTEKVNATVRPMYHQLRIHPSARRWIE